MKTNIRVINDPVFGFIPINNELIAQLIEHPYFQRLSRIKQLGMASFAFPGAQHTRFLHSLGATYLMSEAIATLRAKGHNITQEEAIGATACILLHDIGHGPFSHVLENSIVKGISHEEISLVMMNLLNEEFDGQLDTCISIFKDQYPKKYLHQLVSGQLDVDRLDYLRRDCFFTGVSEGNIGSERILKIMDVYNNNLVVESKGIYSLENFFLSRRLMYWQVYHHKTAICAENMLINILQRAKELVRKNVNLFAPPALSYFLKNNIEKENFSVQSVYHFINLDDSDILSSMKVWSSSEDHILSTLCRSFLNRELFKIEILSEPVSKDRIQEYILKYKTFYNLSENDAHYFLSSGVITAGIYNQEDNSIGILYKDGTLKSIDEVSDLLNLQLLSQKNEKYFFVYLNI